MFVSVLPFVLIFVVMYFLIIRPQRQQLKKRGEMLAQCAAATPSSPAAA